MDAVTYDPADFFGFREIPFHRHLGLAFARAADAGGAALVALPAARELTRAGVHGSAAAYAIAEVASALAAADALAALGLEQRAGVEPVMLARGARFHPCGEPRGRIEARACLARDARAAVERLRTARKATVTLEAQVHAQDGTLVGEGSFAFYVRLMPARRLHALRTAAAAPSGPAR